MNRFWGIGIYIFFYIVFLLAGCGKQGKEVLSGIVPVVVPADFDSIIGIKRWMAFGAFDYDTAAINASRSFFIDDLKKYGVKEGKISGETPFRGRDAALFGCLSNQKG